MKTLYCTFTVIKAQGELQLSFSKTRQPCKNITTIRGITATIRWITTLLSISLFVTSSFSNHKRNNDSYDDRTTAQTATMTGPQPNQALWVMASCHACRSTLTHCLSHGKACCQNHKQLADCSLVMASQQYFNPLLTT